MAAETLVRLSTSSCSAFLLNSLKSLACERSHKIPSITASSLCIHGAPLEFFPPRAPHHSATGLHRSGLAEVRLCTKGNITAAADPAFAAASASSATLFFFI